MTGPGRDRPSGKGQAGDRDARLKAALRANLMRRKDQARARRDETDAADTSGDTDGAKGSDADAKDGA
ncbi:hypothetical protein MLD63_08105 [Paracoccus sp. TK19116]|uniref:DUF4169 family protein n=1 Tax=Paracoccus albicereus TaxID=2922394 RepID=A0ABT1MQ05_9RHOB|nr:hypothetical protein [Paracoccus albicereus]MCQ0970385.1 hypothetical protein [Paracoccus albicereus]